MGKRSTKRKESSSSGMGKRSAKRKEKYDDDGGDLGSDRISRLPESVLLRILCFLSPKKAVQTSVLSRSWRHLGPTRPVIDLRGDCESSHATGTDFCENCFDGNSKSFISVLEKTFQRYHDQNLFTQELRLDMLEVDSKSISLLEKWIPILINPNSGVTTFRLSFASWPFDLCFNVPSVVLKTESLQELNLTRCSLDEINLIDNFLLKNLQKLSLSRVDFADEALEKIISGCPLVKNVVFFHCKGFKSMNINGIKNRYLNHFEFSRFYGQKADYSTEIDVPSLQSIRISGCSKWYHNHKNFFPHLKSLYLFRVKLSEESIDDFSYNFPRLEELEILDCWGFEEIKLSSRSIKRLLIQARKCTKKVSIEIPNILYFEFSSWYLTTTLSIRTTSREWKSHLILHGCLYYYDEGVLPRIRKLFEMLKALSQSQISLTLTETIYYKTNQIEWDFNYRPVAVEHLGLNISRLCPYSRTRYLNSLFSVFHPRYTNAVRVQHNDDEEVSEFLWKTLIDEREKTECGWEQHLEEVSIEASDEEGKVWHGVQWACLPEWSKNQKIRFRLNWRD